MKNNILIILFMIMYAGVGTVLSQSFNGGVRAGVVASQVSGDEQAGFDKAGIYGGGFVNLYFSKKSSVQMELNFIQKGSRKNPKPDKGDYDKYLCRLNYIEMPFLYKIDIGKRLTFEVGAAIAYLVNSKEEDENGEVDPYLQFKKYEVSIIGGGYVNITPHWMVNLRYENTFPFLPVREHASRAQHLLNKGQYNSLIVLSVQYQIKAYDQQ